MQVDTPTLKRYQEKAPELLQSVESGGAEATTVMRKNPGTGYCVKLEGGLCGIQKQYGETFLSDACSLYPRITRAVGDTILITASASCPEITRLAFEQEDAMVLENATAQRLPYGLKDYLPPELNPEDALATHQIFLDAVRDVSVSVEHVFARIASVGRSLELIQKKDWPHAASFYMKNTDTRLPEPEKTPADPFNLVLALAGLIVASHKVTGERLNTTIADMEEGLCARIDWHMMQIHTDEKSHAAYEQIKQQWRQKGAARYDIILRRWLTMQLSLALFPFGGIGQTLSERVTIIGVRLATFKLALMSTCGIHGEVLPQETVVRIAQSLARFLDHLGDATFSLAVYNETGWTGEARLRGLLES
jgi:hypothetical protein